MPTTPSEQAALASTLTFGTVILVPFPFTNQQASKKRPAIVVSSRDYVANRPDVIIMAVTSQLRWRPAFGEAWLQDWEAAGLLKPSAAKPVIATLEQSLILRRLGELSDQDWAAVSAALSDIIGCTGGL